MSCTGLLCGLYFELAAGYIPNLPRPPEWAKEKFGPDVHYKYDFNSTANPRGRLSFGYEWNPSARTRISLEFRHESWIGTQADKGQNGIWISARGFPWRWNPK